MTLAEAYDADRPDSVPHQGIQISERERNDGTISPTNRALAALILSCRGYVILKDALQPDFVESLRRELSLLFQDCHETAGALETGPDVASILKLNVSGKHEATFWFRKSRWRIFPRLTPPVSDPALLANPFVMPILEDLLGSDLLLRFVSSDTCEKASILQSPHRDIDGTDIFAENRWRARGFLVNVPLMECGLHNGPLEVWPGGSHMWTSDLLDKYGLCLDIQDNRNPPVEHFAEYLPSIKLAMRPGEVLIRDLALWHRGTPNPTEQPRTMMTLGYFRRDYVYGYADPSYNVDEELFGKLHPRVQKMYQPYFSLANRLRRRQSQIRSAVKKAGRAWLRARSQEKANGPT